MDAFDVLVDRAGGYWGNGDPVHSIADWKYEVANDDTRMGYWDWVQSKRQMAVEAL